MPTKKQLEELGEHRLVKGITNAGGFSSVARKLGLRPPRRVNGFWDNLEILNEVWQPHHNSHRVDHVAVLHGV